MKTDSFAENAGVGTLDFCGERFFCDRNGCLFWPAHNILIVADLHLEKGAAFATHGILAPPYDSYATLSRLKASIGFWEPQKIISLGDSFHREDSAELLSSELQLQLTALTKRVEWIWISGNHDPAPPPHLGGIGLDEFSIGDIVFRHEQAIGDVTGEITGHLHPCARLVRKGKSLRRRCFVNDSHRLILPAFGTFTGGLDLSHPAFANLLEPTSMEIRMLGNEGVYPICAKNAGYCPPKTTSSTLRRERQQPKMS